MFVRRSSARAYREGTFLSRNLGPFAVATGFLTLLGAGTAVGETGPRPLPIIEEGVEAPGTCHDAKVQPGGNFSQATAAAAEKAGLPNVDALATGTALHNRYGHAYPYESVRVTIDGDNAVIQLGACATQHIIQ